MSPGRKEPQFGYTPDEDDTDLAAPRGRYVETARRRSYFPAIAVVIALMAFGWLIWKSYRHHHITTASGQPPVITADPAPVKVKPEHPSGTDIPYRDTTVYDELAQGKQKSQTPPIEHLLQPPEEPMQKPVAAPTVQPVPAIQAEAVLPPTACCSANSTFSSAASSAASTNRPCGLRPNRFAGASSGCERSGSGFPDSACASGTACFGGPVAN